MNLRRMGKNHALLFGAIGMGALAMTWAGGAVAAVQGQCSNCHTMHASQDNQAMGSGPFDVLLLFDCLGCHTGTNRPAGTDPGGTVAPSNAPGVLDTVDPFAAGTFLAGGNFYSVESGNDAHGHNVKVLPTGHTDALLGNIPPGYDGTTPTVAALESPFLSCAGATGCHGDLTVSRTESEAQSFAAIAGAHHGQTGVVDGSTVGQSFRFLLGMPGGEDDDYEFTTNASDHNVYPGKARAADSDEADGGLGALTMSGLCAKCHANFHNSSPAGTSTGIEGSGWGNPWIRHPTDFDFSTLDPASEYFVNMDTYNPLVPVGRDITQVGAANFQGLVGLQDSNVGETGGNIVICLSCHRAHGSQYNDILRWDYEDMVAGAPTGGMEDNGCFYCHATKD